MYGQGARFMQLSSCQHSYFCQGLLHLTLTLRLRCSYIETGNIRVEIKETVLKNVLSLLVNWCFFAGGQTLDWYF